MSRSTWLLLMLSACARGGVDDAAAEGVLTNTEGLTTTDEVKNPTRLYRYLWESINGEGSWAKNPWVWCLSFRRVTP